MMSARAGKVDAGRARHRVSKTELTGGDRILRVVSGVASAIPMAILGVIAVVIFITALPSIIFSGLSFFTGSVFNFGNLYATTTITHNGVQAPPHAVYGVLPLIIGTLSTSIIALVLAVPISVGGVLMLSEIIPRRIADSMAVFLELLAGIPSVVFGLWGVAVFGPFLSAHVFPALTAILQWAGRGGAGSADREPGPRRDDHSNCRVNHPRIASPRADSRKGRRSRTRDDPL